MRSSNGSDHPYAIASAHTALVLVVDDDEGIRKALSRFIAAQGYRVETVADAEEALAACQRELPVVVLSDIALPGMSGIELFDELRRRYGSGLAFIGMSGSAPCLAAARAAGVEPLLPKPLDLQSLVALLRGRSARAA